MKSRLQVKGQAWACPISFCGSFRVLSQKKIFFCFILFFKFCKLMVWVLKRGKKKKKTLKASESESQVE
jgi:hypothetical protein